MIIPVRCFSCGGVIAHKWEEFNELKAAGLEDAEALDQDWLEALLLPPNVCGSHRPHLRGCTIQRFDSVSLDRRSEHGGPWVSLAYTWRLGAVRPQFKSGRAHLIFILSQWFEPFESNDADPLD